jgi:hypothetical protein
VLPLLLAACRDPESVARSVAAAREQIEASQAVRNKSFIPLSKAGIQLGSSAEVRRMLLACLAHLRVLCAWCLCSEVFVCDGRA